MFATGLCILDGRSRRVSCCPDVTAVAGWGGLAPRGSRCIPRGEEVGAAPQPNLYLLYVIFINNYLYKWPPVFGVICWVRGQGQISFVYLLGKDVRAGSQGWIMEISPVRSTLRKGVILEEAPGDGAVCRQCFQQGCCWQRWQEADPVPAIQPGCEHTEPRGHRPHP